MDANPTTPAERAELRRLDSVSAETITELRRLRQKMIEAQRPDDGTPFVDAMRRLAEARRAFAHAAREAGDWPVLWLLDEIERLEADRDAGIKIINSMLDEKADFLSQAATARADALRGAIEALEDAVEGETALRNAAMAAKDKMGTAMHGYAATALSQQAGRIRLLISDPRP